MANKKMKWFSIATLACAASLCIGFGAANVTADAAATFAITATSVRTNDPSGLRFKVDVPAGAKVENAYTRITLTTSEGEDYTTDVPTTVYRADGGWNAVLLDIPESDYVTEVTAQAFATIDGEACETVAHTSSIAKTALKAYSENLATMGDVKQYIQFEEATTETYTFANYTAGEQYAKNEEHKLDDCVTMYTTECHFTGELRMYSSSTHNGYAIIKCDGVATGLTFNAGNKTDTVIVYGSNDNGKTWKTIQEVGVTSSFADKTVAFDDEYQQLKLDVKGSNQVQFKSMTLTYKALPVSDDIKAEREAANLAASVATLTTNSATETGSFDLPTVEGAEKVEWFLKEASVYANVTDNKLNVTSLPATDSDNVTLTLYAKVTITVGNFTATANTKEFSFVIVAPTSQAKVEQTFTWTASQAGYSDAADVTSIALGDITLSLAKGSGSNQPKYYNNGTNLRIYAKNTLTFTVPAGCTIVSVKFTCSGSSYVLKTNTTTNGTITTSGSVSTLTPTDGTKEITILNSGSAQYRITKIEITYTK